MTHSRIRAIKHAQKESFIAREVIQIFREVVREQPDFGCFDVTRVVLSPDKGACTVYLYSAQGEPSFTRMGSRFMSLRPLVRHALSQTMTSRYVPEIIFRYDHTREKQHRIETLLDQLKSRDGN